MVVDKERPNWIDYSKVLMIYLVVLGHYTTVMGLPFKPSGVYNMMKIITLFHMPFFFMVSGYLYKNISVKKTIKKGWVQLMKPYFLMCLISCSIIAFFYLLCHELSLYNAATLVIGIITSSDSPHSVWNWSSPLWFCYSLFIIKVAVALFQNVANHKLVKWAGYIALMIGSVYVLYKGNCMPFHLDSSLVGFLFFIFGFFLKDIITRVASSPIKIRIMTIALMLLIEVITAFTNLDYSQKADLSINVCRFGPKPLLFVISGVCGSLMVLLLMSLITVNSRTIKKIILQISNGTIVILGFHWGIYKLFFSWWLSSYNVIVAFVIALVVLLICYLLILLSSKYWPALLGGRSIK